MHFCFKFGNPYLNVWWVIAWTSSKWSFKLNFDFECQGRHPQNNRNFNGYWVTVWRSLWSYIDTHTDTQMQAMAIPNGQHSSWVKTCWNIAYLKLLHLPGANGLIRGITEAYQQTNTTQFHNTNVAYNWRCKPSSMETLKPSLLAQASIHLMKTCAAMYHEGHQWVFWDGGTNAPFVNFSISKSFGLARVPFIFFKSHLYLTGVTAAELRRHLSNIKVIFNI